MAYYWKSDFDNFLKIIDLSIKKNKTDPKAHFYKGTICNYKGRVLEAVKSLKKAIKLDPNKSIYVNELGNSYNLSGKWDQALKAYKLATTMEDASNYYFKIIPEVYLMKKDFKNALKYFYIAKEHLSNEPNAYNEILHKIAKLEIRNNNYTKLEIAYKELTEKHPTNFNCYKMIQAYYGQKEYEKAEPYKKLIYDNQAKDTLMNYKKRWYRYDYFYWKGHRIYAFEKFSLIKNEPYYQHRFYIFNENFKVIIKFSTNNTPISFELSGSEYTVEMDNNETVLTFPSKFKNHFNYKELKKNILYILNKKAKNTNKFKTPIYRVRRRPNIP
jgi:tetratricopeptide (TPR) repeat protein